VAVGFRRLRALGALVPMMRLIGGASAARFVSHWFGPNQGVANLAVVPYESSSPQVLAVMACSRCNAAISTAFDLS
jgi:hypothetical protein